jgi:hypothetical protein
MSSLALNPANIYTPQPLGIENYNFELSPSTLPPTGWQTGGVGLNTSVTLSYDTSTPYEGANSLVIAATAQFGGASVIAQYPVVPGQVYGLTAALKSNTGDQANVEIVFLDFNGNQIPVANELVRPLINTTSASWQLLSVQGTVPFNAVTAQIQCYMSGASGGTGEFDIIQATLLSNAIPYYLSLVPSQWRAAPKFLSWLAALLQPLVDVGICAAGLNAAFDIDTAVGSQLDVLGQFIGVSRTLPFAPGNSIATAVIDVAGSSYVNGDVLNVVQAGATGGQVIYNSTGPSIVISNVGSGYTNATGLATTGGHGTGLTVTITTVAWSPVLDDVHYRILLMAKILQNQWNGQVDSLWNPWQLLFPGGRIYITDNQNMTATVLLVGAFDGLVQQMIEQGLIVPRPETVQYVYEFPQLPGFGFGSLNPTFVAGFGRGYFNG